MHIFDFGKCYIGSRSLSKSSELSIAGYPPHKYEEEIVGFDDGYRAAGCLEFSHKLVGEWAGKS